MKHFALALFLVLLVQPRNFIFQVEAANDFITTKGIHFMLNGSPYYANGFNAYWLMIVAEEPSERQKVTAAFKEASAHGLTVARTWAFSDGGSSPLQHAPGEYNEKMFQGLDFAIAEAKKYGIRLILSLANNYDSFGGKKQYVEWARSNNQNLPSDDDFFRNAVTKGYYKNHARAWVAEMATYVKSLDRNHLLEVGLEGFYGQSTPQRKDANPSFSVGTDYIGNNRLPGIDFATVHAYPDQWISNPNDQSEVAFLNQWLDSHIDDAQNVLTKPVLITEFGKSVKDGGYNINQREAMFNTVFDKVYASVKRGGAAAGGLFWQLLSEGMDLYGDGYEIVMSRDASTVNIIEQQCRKLAQVSKDNQPDKNH